MSFFSRGRMTAAVLGAAVFAASYTLTAAPPSARLQRVLELAAQDGERTVCASPAPCVRGDAAYTLLVFFSARDCAICLYDTAVLEGVYRATSRDQLNVLAVAYDMSPAESRKFAAASGITYPLYVDPARVERHVGNPRREGAVSPLKVLLDREGRVLGSWESRTMVQWHHDDARRLLARVAR